MKQLAFRATLFILASPIIFIGGLYRFARYVRFWRVAYSADIMCVNCRKKIMLIGAWKCSCSYVYVGHCMRICPVCTSFPRIVRCFACGVSRLLPEEP